MWFYEPPVGVIQIKLHKAIGRYIILVGDERYGSYLAPEQALDDLLFSAIGCDEWDLNPSLAESVPDTLSEWNHL